MEVAQGHVSDRPFARMIYTIAGKHFTGDLVLTEAGRGYKISWEDGKAVAAESGAAADSVGRVALAAGLVTSTHVSRSLEVLAQTPAADPLEVLTGLARLSAEQVIRLKRRMLAHRASRVFALTDARFVLDNARSLRADPDVPSIDARWLIHNGLKMHYSVERLDKELAGAADRSFKLAADATGVMNAFGFADAERPVIERLRQRGWSVQQLVDASRDLERRVVLAVVYSLMATDCLEQAAEVSAPPPATASTATSAPPATTPPPASAAPRRTRPSTGAPAVPGAAAAAQSSLAQGTQRRILFPGASSSAAAGTRPPSSIQFPGQPRPGAAAAPAIAASPSATPIRRSHPSSVPPDPSGAAALEIRQLISGKAADIDTGADHFSLLEVSRSASTLEVRTAYFSLAKRLHPDRLRAVGVDDMANDAQRVFARINLAFGVLSDPSKRSEYLRVVTAGGEEAVKKLQSQAEEAAIRALRAEETYRMGEMALRRNHFAEAKDLFDQAAELAPDEAEFVALAAWAGWLCAEDKAQVAVAVQRRLSQAISMAPTCVPAHFYSGQVAKQTGRTQAAIESFKRVMELMPTHAEASLELRVLLSREKKDPSSKSGLGFLDKKKKR